MAKRQWLILLRRGVELVFGGHLSSSDSNRVEQERRISLTCCREQDGNLGPPSYVVIELNFHATLKARQRKNDKWADDPRDAKREE